VHPRWPVEIHPIGPTAAATLAWRHRGRLRVSVVAKATFAFVLDGPMPLVAPDDIHATEAHHDGDPARSLRAESDLVPYRTHADVVLTGHAPVPDESATVRLAVYRDRPLIDKSFDVVPSGDLEGTHRVPLVYEQTPGGPEWDDNPVGTSLPSIVDSSDPQRPVGFGPIAAAWPVRARRLGGSDPAPLRARIPVLPDELDWRYYSAAPADQVMEYLQGDEWLVLENLIDDCPTARMQLPNARAEARIFGLGPAPIVKMLADNLHLDLDRAVASITWRGSFEIAHEDAMRGLAVMVGVAVNGQPIAWPAPPPRREAVVVPAAPGRARPPAAIAPTLPSPRAALPIVPPPPPSARAPLPVVPPPPPSARLPFPSDDDSSTDQGEMTMEIRDEPTSQPALPFSRLAAPRPPVPAAPPAPPASRASDPDASFESTKTMSAADARRALAAAEALPFAPAPVVRPVIPTSSIREPSYSLDETSIVEDEPEETTVPMAQSFRRARPAARPSQGIPGAPWSGVPAAPVPRPQAELDERTRSIRLDESTRSIRLDESTRPLRLDESTRALRRNEMLARLGVMPQGAPVIPAAPQPPIAPAPTPPIVAVPAPPIVPPAPPEAPRGERAPSWSWVGVADEAKVDMNPPKPPRAPSSPAVKNTIYNRFTKKK
jgi:hypothetical protein